MLTNFLNWWEKQGRFCLIGMGLGLIILGGTWFFSSSGQASSDVQFYPAQEISKAPISLMVDIRGAVEKPGVYELEQGSRLQDLVTKAGGFSSQVDQVWVDLNLNMARELKDGQKVYIPKKGERSKEQVVDNQPESVKSGSFINLNTADKSELETLTGIGPAFAKRIIDYRQENGGFKSAEEIQAVSGIGEKTFEKIKNQISI